MSDSLPVQATMSEARDRKTELPQQLVESACEESFSQSILDVPESSPEAEER